MKNVGLAFVIVSLAVVGAFAQEKKVASTSDLKPGDKLVMRQGAGWQRVEVVEVLSNNRVKVRVKFGGRDTERTMPLTFLRYPDNAAQSPAAKSEKRTWTDSTGKFKIEASFVELADGKVRLKKDDGEILSIPLDKLSAEDSQLVQSLMKGGDSASPFVSESKGTTAEPKKEKPADDVDLASADLSSIRELTIGDSGTWNLKPDAVTLGDQTPANQTIQLKQPPASRNSFFEKTRRTIFHHQTGRAFVSHVYSWQGEIARVEVCDLLKGKSVGDFELKASGVLVDVSATGERVLVRKDGHLHAHKNRLDVYEMTGSTPKHVVSWLPYDEKDWTKRDMRFASFAGEDHVVTVSVKNKLIVWRLDGLKAIHTLQVPGTPAVSTGHNQLAVPMEFGVAILDPITGETSGRLATRGPVLSAVQFSPDGRWLVGVRPQNVLVWDLATGEVAHDVSVMKQMAADSVDWVSEGYVLVDNTHLVDLERRVVLWQYQGIDAGAVHAGTCWSVQTSQDKKSKALLPISMPHDRAKSVANGLDADSLLALKPGTSVSVQVLGLPEANQRDIVTELLTAKLKQSGMTVAAGGKVVLEASVTDGKEHEVDYHRLGKQKVKEKIHSITLKENGKVVWRATYIKGPPYILSIKLGEAAKDAIAKAMATNMPFFQDARIPTYVARPGDKGAYGASKLTPSGLQPSTVN